MRLDHVLRSLSLHFVLASLAGLVACGGSDPTPQNQQANVNGGGGSSGAPAPGPTGTAASPSGTSTATPSPTGTTSPTCVDVGGDWTGPVDGMAYAAPGDAQPTEKVSGTATVKLSKNASGDFDLQTGSSFNITISTNTILGDVKTQQQLTGTVKCGQLNATSSATVAGTSYSGTATCTFDANGCKGNFTVNAGTDKAAVGTFTLAR